MCIASLFIAGSKLPLKLSFKHKKGERLTILMSKYRSWQNAIVRFKKEKSVTLKKARSQHNTSASKEVTVCKRMPSQHTRPEKLPLPCYKQLHSRVNVPSSRRRTKKKHSTTKQNKNVHYFQSKRTNVKRRRLCQKSLLVSRKDLLNKDYLSPLNFFSYTSYLACQRLLEKKQSKNTFKALVSSCFLLIFKMLKTQVLSLHTPLFIFNLMNDLFNVLMVSSAYKLAFIKINYIVS